MRSSVIASTLSALIFLLTACGSNGDTRDVGVFISTKGVEGLHYSCVPSQNKGMTNDKGEYTYQENDECTFSIGGLILGSATGNAVTTPLSLTKAKSFDDSNAIKMSQVLLSLDNDNNISNGIQIDSSIDGLFEMQLLLQDLNLSVLQSKIDTVYPGRVIVDSETAYEYLYDTLDNIPQVKVSTKLTTEMISGKSFEFTNSDEETHYADFKSDGTYEDNVHECTPKWHIDGATVKINNADCPIEFDTPLSFTFYEEPLQGGLVRIDDHNRSTNAIISQVKTNGSLLTSSEHWYSDNDAEHVTFVNQTDHDMCISAKLYHHLDKTMVLHSHEAKYMNVHKQEGDDPRADDYYFDYNYNKSTENCDKYRSKSSFDMGYIHSVRRGHVYYIYDNDVLDDINVYKDLSGCDTNVSKPAILFAHGLHDSQKAWTEFAEYAKKKGWRVFRTSVSENGSVMKRAHMLSDYIVAIANQCKIGDNQLRVVGHSMGGLDLRYILSADSKYENLKTSRQIIERAYTLATPHGGADLADFVTFLDDGVKSCSVKAMKGFNANLPYSRIQSNDRSLLAIRFHLAKEVEDITNDDLDTLAEKQRKCYTDPSGYTECDYIYVQPNDGVVWTKDMSHGSMPYAKKLYRGKHTPTNYISWVYGEDYGNISKSILEQHRTAVLHKILNDHRSENIPYYNDY